MLVKKVAPGLLSVTQTKLSGSQHSLQRAADPEGSEAKNGNTLEAKK